LLEDSAESLVSRTAVAAALIFPYIRDTDRLKLLAGQRRALSNLSATSPVNEVTCHVVSCVDNESVQFEFRSPPRSGDDVISLRGQSDQVAAQLVKEINERVKAAGVEVIDARIAHLAYAPEIAQAMLQRQQAGAIIAARQRIVEGAVGMVEMALEMLSRREIVQLDDERKASMVSNLLVVLCGERAAQPIVNTGTIYS